MILGWKKTLLAFLIIGVAAIGAEVWYSMTTAKQAVIDFRDPALVALGKQVYGQACASCHGVNLEGQANWKERKPDGKLPAPPHDATGHTWHHADIELFKIVKNGVQAFAGPNYKSDMPAFEKTLSDEQIKAVIAYIKSTWPEKLQTYQQQVTEQAHSTGG